MVLCRCYYGVVLALLWCYAGVNMVLCWCGSVVFSKLLCRCLLLIIWPVSLVFDVVAAVVVAVVVAVVENPID